MSSKPEPEDDALFAAGCSCPPLRARHSGEDWIFSFRPLPNVSNNSMSGSSMTNMANLLKPSGKPAFLIATGTGLIEMMLVYSLPLLPVDLAAVIMAHAPSTFFNSNPRSSSAVKSRPRQACRSLRSVAFSANDKVKFLLMLIGSPLVVTSGLPLSSSPCTSNWIMTFCRCLICPWYSDFCVPRSTIR